MAAKPTSKDDYGPPVLSSTRPSSSSSPKPRVQQTLFRSPIGSTVASSLRPAIPFSPNPFSSLASDFPTPNISPSSSKNPTPKSYASILTKDEEQQEQSDKEFPQINFQPQYCYKKDIFPLFPIEAELQHKNISQVLQTMFLPGWQWPAKIGSKLQNYYEFILVDTESCIFTHHYDNLDHSKVTHSKCQIVKVLHLSDWKQEPHTPIQFSRQFSPPTYTYFDYQDAWIYTFFKQNKTLSHSWFFHFVAKNNLEFPHWFIKFWKYFGPDISIVPKKIQEGYSYFLNNYKFTTHQTHNPPLLTFFTFFSLPWILMWEYHITPIEPLPQPEYLVRKFKIKWWHATKEDKVTLATIQKLFQQHPHITKNPVQDQHFLSSKSSIQARLAAAKTRHEYKQILSEASSELGDDDEDDLLEVSSQPQEPQTSSHLQQQQELPNYDPFSFMQ